MWEGVELDSNNLMRIWSCFWESAQQSNCFAGEGGVNYDRSRLTINLDSTTADLLPAFVELKRNFRMIAKNGETFSLVESRNLHAADLVSKFSSWMLFKELIVLMKSINQRLNFPRGRVWQCERREGLSFKTTGGEGI